MMAFLGNLVQNGMEASARQHAQQASSGEVHGATSFLDKASDFFGQSHYAEDYQRYLGDLDKAYETRQTNSARAWDEYMQSTQVQRLVKDIEAAGLNPWLAVQSGLNAGSGYSSAGSGSSARYHVDSKKSDDGNILKIMLLALLASAKMAALI